MGGDGGARGENPDRDRGRARADTLRGPPAGARHPDGLLRASAGRPGAARVIVGEPGIGKSRLLYEFRRSLGAEATWLEGHCVPFGQSTAFLPLIDLLRRSFEIEESDPEATMVRKIERGVLALGEDLRPILPFVLHLLSVGSGDTAVLGMDPQQRRGEIFDALRRLTARAAEARPQVVV